MEDLRSYSNTLIQIIGEIVDENFSKSLPNSVKIYQELVSYEKRCVDSSKLCIKYREHVPIIVNCLNSGIKLKKNKYLVHRELECSKLMAVIRTQLILESHQAMFLYVDNILLDNMKSIGEIYNTYLLKNNIHKNGDKYFYVILEAENTFG